MLSVSSGWSAGIVAARRVFEDPTSTWRQHTASELSAIYSLLWSYYNNSLFNREAGATALWTQYKAAYGLYRNIRTIYNPTRRLVDFYVGQIYPGVLSPDGKPMPDGVECAIPLSPDTPAELAAAIAQFWQWSNWQSRKSVQVRYGAALGSVLVEVTDEPETGKVTAANVWPGFVPHLELDATGNVKEYTVSYLAMDPDVAMGSYLYSKVVNADEFRYFKNMEPFDYGDGAVVPNPYGFAPAVWIKHTDTGSDRGSPAIAGSLPKIDELNNLVAHAHDQVHKVIGAPLVLWSGGSLSNLYGTAKRGATSDEVSPTDDSENVLILRGPQGGHVDTLAGNLSLGDVLKWTDKLLAEIEDDHSELILYKKLREMSHITGPGAARVMDDVAQRVAEAAANYDQQNVKLFQMVAAIGGFRANAGAWGTLTPQQQKFLPFNLDSYRKTELDFSIQPRALMNPTKLETALEKQAVWTGVGLAITAGVPLEVVLRDEGWSEAQIAEIKQIKDAEDAKAKAAQAALLSQQQQQQPTNPQQQPGGPPQQNMSNMMPAGMKNGKP
jgi:hypothetical protein